MHEMSLCESLIKIIEDQADEKCFTQVSTVVLELGVFAGVEVDALRFCFDICCRNTVADSAQLVISRQPAQACCQDCNASFAISDWLSTCPNCNGYNLRRKGGEQMRIKQLEVL
ncbi:hydrogenase maturation nickel metallochaperone HypA [Vibrio hangzhouensis]|uniref:Hydrogenase maturation factor HypA n=1 Tax=Vibrio hangzhouensis TaxID=462991 RepID=A0A1H5RP77_9VIBR|nr:hydrogenase maturation nickel metallochaperone HypA [Vibrio hangzhouensis]SEF39924.1 hydrogenase nickel incorporation protein HypA/HybF [Vibrio hangzhouensis]